jgi:uncharacterized protein (TIGR00730 family)
MKRIAVYCGSNKGKRPEFAQAAKDLGKLLVQNQLELVYGGGRLGLMGIVADAVLEHGGHVIGVIPEKLMMKEVAHTKISDLRVVPNMHERKALMASLADGFIVLPGGYGTFEEMFEILTWAQLGWHQKPIGLLNCGDYYTNMLNFLRQSVNERFMRQEHLAILQVSNHPAELLQLLQAYVSNPGLGKLKIQSAIKSMN